MFNHNLDSGAARSVGNMREFNSDWAVVTVIIMLTHRRRAVGGRSD